MRICFANVCHIGQWRDKCNCLLGKKSLIFHSGFLSMHCVVPRTLKWTTTPVSQLQIFNCQNFMESSRHGGML
jgi:hypothetical protein